MKLECFEVWIRGSRTGLKGNISKIQGRARKRTLIEHGHGSWAPAQLGPRPRFNKEPTDVSTQPRQKHLPVQQEPVLLSTVWAVLGGIYPGALTVQLSGRELSWKTQTPFDDPVHWVRLTKSHPVLLLSILHCTLVWLGSREPSRKLFCIKLYPPIHMLKL